MRNANLVGYLGKKGWGSICFLWEGMGKVVVAECQWKTRENMAVLKCFELFSSTSLSSTRYMSTLYSNPEFPTKGPDEINKELMENVSHNPMFLLNPLKVRRYLEALWKKKFGGQPVTFTDMFGMLIGETLIADVS